MDYKIGDRLYLYTARNGKFNIYEGEVVVSKRGYYSKCQVDFKNRRTREWCPRGDQIGHVLGGGPRIWLLERDDALAKRMFLEYELGKLAELEKAIAKKKELIEVLREEGT